MDSVVRDAHILLLRTATNQPKQGQINQRRLVAEEKVHILLVHECAGSMPPVHQQQAIADLLVLFGALDVTTLFLVPKAVVLGVPKRSSPSSHSREHNETA